MSTDDRLYVAQALRELACLRRNRLHVLRAWLADRAVEDTEAEILRCERLAKEMMYG